jgi:hypothetical protein
MTKEYFCRAYRLETYMATTSIEAESQAEALRQLKELDKNGDLDFEDYCEAEPTNEFVIEEGNKEDELTVTVPENCLYVQRGINAALLSALEYCEQVLRDHEQYDAEGDSAESKAASMARAAIANAKPSTL